LALGKRSTVFESEELITEFISDGVDYADIVDGAKKLRAYNDLTGGRHAVSDQLMKPPPDPKYSAKQ
jgi:hypothetical protein